MSKFRHSGPLDSKTRHGIPVPTTAPESLRQSVVALTTAVEELSRQRGSLIDSALTVRDLIKLGIVSPEAVQLLDPGGSTYSLTAVAGMSQAHQGFGPIGTGVVETAPAPATPAAEFDLDWLLGQLDGRHLTDAFATQLLLVDEANNRFAAEAAARQQAAAALQTDINLLAGDFTVLAGELNAEVIARQAAVAALLAQVQGLATDVASSIYVQPTAPVPGVAGVPDPLINGARWYKSDDNNHPHVWDASTSQWVSLLDPRIGQNAASITILQTGLTTAQGDISANSSAISVLDSTVVSLGGQVTAQAASITSLQTGLTNAQGNISANSTAISGLTSTVSTLAGTVTAQAASITSLQADIADLQLFDFLDTAVSGNTAAIQALEARMTYSDGELTAVASDIVALQAAIDLLEGGEAALEAVAALEVRIVATETGLSAAASDIVSLQGEITSIDEQFGLTSSAISALDTRLTSAEGVNTSQSSQITTLQSGLTTAQGDIAANSTAVSGLDTRVTSAEGTLTSQATQLTNLSSGLTALQGTVSGQATAISGLDTRVTSAEGTLTSQATQLTNLSSGLTALQGTVSGQATAISGLDTRVTSAEGSITSQAASITTLQSGLSTAQGDISATSTALGALTTRVTNAEGTLTSQASQLTSLSSGLTALQGTVSGQATAISGLDTRVTSAEGTLTSQASQLTSLSSGLTTLQGTVGGQATAISGLDTRVTSAEGTITSQATQLTSLSSTVGSHTTSISTLTSTTNGLSAQYTIKVNANGFVSGFGLASTPINGTPISTFSVLADNFVIAHPGSTPVAPFIVTGGVVRMQNVLIGNAVIGDLSVGKLTTGSLTAQVTQNADWIVGTGRIIWTSANNAFVKASGIGFGTSNQFLEWFGPRPAGGNLALCSEATAISYLKTNGDAYFGGSLSAGILRNAATGTNINNNAEVIVGPFGTNGGNKTVVASYYFNHSHLPSGSLSFVNPPTATAVLERRLGGGSWVQIGSQSFTGGVDYLPGNGPGEPGIYEATISGSFTVTDTNTSMSNFEYRLRLTARNVSLFTPGITEQRLTVVSTEG